MGFCHCEFRGHDYQNMILFYAMKWDLAALGSTLPSASLPRECWLQLTATPKPYWACSSGQPGRDMLLSTHTQTNLARDSNPRYDDDDIHHWCALTRTELESGASWVQCRPKSLKFVHWEWIPKGSYSKNNGSVLNIRLIAADFYVDFVLSEEKTELGSILQWAT